MSKDKQSATLKDMLNVLHIDPPPQRQENGEPELEWAARLIVRVQNMIAGDRDTLRAAYLHGPIEDGDVPSKSCRDRLIDDGFIAQIVVRGQSGFNACTYRGMWAYKLIEAGA